MRPSGLDYGDDPHHTLSVGLFLLTVNGGRSPSPEARISPIYIDEANDIDNILADADIFYSAYFGMSDDAEVEDIAQSFDPFGIPPYWPLGQRTSALVQMYSLIEPLDPTRAARYLERLRRIADVILANRDDARHFSPEVAAHFPPNGQPVMRSAIEAIVRCLRGAHFTKDRDGKWNTDVVTAGLFTYAMAAFARRVADRPALHARYGADAIRFTTAAIDTYQAFRPELHLVETDAQAYLPVPMAYANLACGSNHSCQVYRSTAGKPLVYNENLSMMKALAEAALASDSTLYRGSAAATDARLRHAAEFPLLIAKNFTFFDKHLHSKTLGDGTPYFEWDHQQPISQIQNTAHGGFELGSLAVLLDDKIPLNALLESLGRSERVALSTPLFVRFANTFLRKIWHYDFQNANGLRNVLDENVNGTSHPTEAKNANEECAGWIPLAQFDRWIWIRCRDATFHPPGYLREDNHAALLRYRQFL